MAYSYVVDGKKYTLTDEQLAAADAPEPEKPAVQQPKGRSLLDTVKGKWNEAVESAFPGDWRAHGVKAPPAPPKEEEAQAQAPAPTEEAPKKGLVKRVEDEPVPRPDVSSGPEFRNPRPMTEKDISDTAAYQAKRDAELTAKQMPDSDKPFMQTWQGPDYFKYGRAAGGAVDDTIGKLAPSVAQSKPYKAYKSLTKRMTDTAESMTSPKALSDLALMVAVPPTMLAKPNFETGKMESPALGLVKGFGQGAKTTYEGVKAGDPAMIGEGLGDVVSSGAMLYGLGKAPVKGLLKAKPKAYEGVKDYSKMSAQELRTRGYEPWAENPNVWVQRNAEGGIESQVKVDPAVNKGRGPVGKLWDAVKGAVEKKTEAPVKPVEGAPQLETPRAKVGGVELPRNAAEAEAVLAEAKATPPPAQEAPVAAAPAAPVAPAKKGLVKAPEKPAYVASKQGAGVASVPKVKSSLTFKPAYDAIKSQVDPAARNADPEELKAKILEVQNQHLNEIMSRGLYEPEDLAAAIPQVGDVVRETVRQEIIDSQNMPHERANGIISYGIKRAIQGPERTITFKNGKRVSEEKKSLGAGGNDFGKSAIPLTRGLPDEFEVRTEDGKKQLIKPAPGERVFVEPYQTPDKKVKFMLHDGMDINITKNSAQDLINRHGFVAEQAAADEFADVKMATRGDDAPARKAAQAELERVRGENIAKYGRQATDWPQEAMDEYNAATSKLNDTQWQGGNVKFQSYVVPGGKNYREVLITSPVKKPLGTEEVGGKWYLKYDDGTRIRVESQGEAERVAIRDAHDAFHSSHWDEPNVLAHARLTDRTTPDGKRVLFIEEIQSDWALARRKNGPETERPVMNENNLDGRTSYKTGTPDHPYLKNWQENTLKRILKMAADEGYDGVSWTSGKQQAERYDLSKHLSSVTAERMVDNEYRIIARGNEGLVIDKIVEADKLPDMVGKDLATKIVKDNGGEYTGLDLKVGGEWATNLYDKQIPNIVKALTKKMGVNIEELPLNTDYLQNGIMFTPEMRDALSPQVRKSLGAAGAPPPAGGEPPPEDPELFKSRVYERLQEENPEFLTEPAPLAVRMRMKQEAERAVNLINTDPDTALSVALGVEELPDVTATSVSIALAEKAKAEGNSSLYATLTKNRSLRQTRYGQEIAAEKASVTDNDATHYIREILGLQLAKLGRKSIGEKLKGLVKEKGGEDSGDKKRGIARIDSDVGAFVSAEQGKTGAEIKKDIDRTFKGASKNPIYDRIIQQLQALDAEGKVGPNFEKEFRAFIEDLVTEKHGIGVTAEQQTRIDDLSADVRAAQQALDDGIGDPAMLHENVAFFKARKEIDDYIAGIVPAHKLRILTGTGFRAIMLASLKSPILNIGSNIEAGTLEALVRRITALQLRGADYKLAKDYVKMVEKIYLETGYDLSRMTGIEDVGKMGERVLGEGSTIHAQGPGPFRKVMRGLETVIFKYSMGYPDMASAAPAFADSVNLNSMRMARGNKAAARELMRDAMRIFPTTPEGKLLRNQAILDAQVATWTNRSTASALSEGMRRLANVATHDLRAGDVLLPFVKTPANVVETGMDYAGLGAIKGAYYLAKMIHSGEYRSKESVKRIIRGLVRSGLGLTLAYILTQTLGDDDFVGAYDPRTAQNEKVKNSRPNSFRFGDKWISADWFGPLGVPMSAMMYARKMVREGTDYLNLAYQYSKGVFENIYRLPGIEEMRDYFMRQVYKRDQTANEAVESDVALLIDEMTARLIPSILNDVAEVSDDYKRSIRTDEPIDTAIHGVEKKIPLVREKLPAARDIYANKIPTEPGANPILFGARVTEDRSNVVTNEIDRIREVTDKSINFTDWDKSSNKKLVDLRQAVGNDRFVALRNYYGQVLQKSLEMMFTNPDYKELPISQKINEINKLDNAIIDYIHAREAAAAGR